MSEPINPKHERAVIALMSAPTIQQAAAAAEVSERTLYRYLRDPEFQKSLKAARREAVSHATARLQQLTGAAVETLQDMLGNHLDPTLGRVAAVRTALHYAYRATELDDLSERITVIEETRRDPYANAREIPIDHVYSPDDPVPQLPAPKPKSN